MCAKAGYWALFDGILSTSQSQNDFLKVLLNVKTPYIHNTNQNLREPYKDLDIVADIKNYRFEWIGHVVKIYQGRRAKKMCVTKQEGNRRRGRPRLRWLEGVRKGSTGHEG